MRVQRYNIFFIPPSFYAKKKWQIVCYLHIGERCGYIVMPNEADSNGEGLYGASV